MKQESSIHEKLIKRGVRLHERFRYKEALLFFQQAFELAPDCPATIYNLANTLHMLDRDTAAQRLLSKLIQMSNADLAAGCKNLRQPNSFRCDALYLMFKVKLHSTRSWSKAFRFARDHLRARKRGLKSVWSVQTIRHEMAELRGAYSTS